MCDEFVVRALTSPRQHLQKHCLRGVDVAKAGVQGSEQRGGEQGLFRFAGPFGAFKRDLGEFQRGLGQIVVRQGMGQNAQLLTLLPDIADLAPQRQGDAALGERGTEAAQRELRVGEQAA